MKLAGLQQEWIKPYKMYEHPCQASRSFLFYYYLSFRCSYCKSLHLHLFLEEPFQCVFWQIPSGKYFIAFQLLFLCGIFALIVFCHINAFPQQEVVPLMSIQVDKDTLFQGIGDRPRDTWETSTYAVYRLKRLQGSLMCCVMS